MTPCVIVDVDGTLADVSSIRHFVEGPSRDFDAFHRASVDVDPHAWVVDLVRDLSASFDIVVVTARNAKFRNETAFWLAMHEIPSDRLIMRAWKDQRNDRLVKADILKQIRAGGHDPVLAIDDNPNVIDLWRSERIPTIVVPGWEA